MAHIIIQHQVADFDTWRPTYEADQPGRKAAGVTTIATLDHRDFAVVRPAHCDGFELVP